VRSFLIHRNKGAEKAPQIHRSLRIAAWQERPDRSAGSADEMG
jgi:hypothetical protein